VPDALQGRAALDQRPCFFSANDAAFFVLFDLEDQALLLPNDGGMKLIAIDAGGDGNAAVG
jgi:hypothetical protein